MNYAVSLKDGRPSALSIAASVPIGLEDDLGNSEVTYIQPTRGWRALNLAELWRYRDLLLIFVQRELKVIYKQTALGAVWIILQPLIAAIIFATVANRIAGWPSEGLPKLLFVFSGMTVWTYFQQSLQNAGNSLVRNRQLVSKVYFPRMVVPLAHTLQPVIDFGVVLVVLIGLMAVYGYHPIYPRLIVVPGLLVQMIFTASGVALFFSALAVRYRDCAYVLPYLIQIWMYASPVIYPMSIFPSHWRPWLAINPVVGIVESFRWVMFGNGTMSGTIVITGMIASVLMLLIGAFFFRRVEREFADIV